MHNSPRWNRLAVGIRLLLVWILLFSVGLSGQETLPSSLKLSLDDAVSLALRNNLTLRSRLIDEEIQRERIREALAAFDPTLFGTASIGRSEVLFSSNFPLNPADPLSPSVTRIISQTGDVGEASLGARGLLRSGLAWELSLGADYSDFQRNSGLTPIFNHATSLSLTQPLLRGAFEEYQTAPIRALELAAGGAHETYRVDVLAKLGEVDQAYYDLIFAREDAGLRRQSLSLAEEQLAITKIRVESGALPRVEITSAESAIAERRADVVVGDAAVWRAMDQLRLLILAFESPSDWQLELEPTEILASERVALLPFARVLEVAESHAPELLRAHYEVARAEVVLRQRENESLPKLDLFATGRLVGLSDRWLSAFTDSFTENEGAASASIGVNFEVPLGNRAARAREGEAQLVVRRSKLELDNLRHSLIFRLRSSIRDVEVAERSIAARSEALRLAAEQLENERLRLELKTSTNFQVFQVEDQLRRRRIETVRARLDYRLSLQRLARAVGVPLANLLEAP